MSRGESGEGQRRQVRGQEGEEGKVQKKNHTATNNTPPMNC